MGAEFSILKCVVMLKYRYDGRIFFLLVDCSNSNLPGHELNVISTLLHIHSILNSTHIVD